MNELLQKHGCSNVFTVPEGLKELMSDISREVLREQPPKIFDFIANYLSVLLLTREHGVLAMKILDDLCDCRPSVSEHLMQLGLERSDAEALAEIIKEEIENFEPVEGKEKVKETEILKRILQRYSLDEEMTGRVCQITRNSYRDYWYRKRLLEQSLKVVPEEPWEIAARHTLEIYKRTKPSFSELNRATQKIQAAYKGYYVRKNLLRHLKPKKKKVGPKVDLPGSPLDIAASRNIDLGRVIDINVIDDKVAAMFSENAGDNLGLSYDPMKTITHVEDFEDEGDELSRAPASRTSKMITPKSVKSNKSMNQLPQSRTTLNQIKSSKSMTAPETRQSGQQISVKQSEHARLDEAQDSDAESVAPDGLHQISFVAVPTEMLIKTKSQEATAEVAQEVPEDITDDRTEEESQPTASVPSSGPGTGNTTDVEDQADIASSEGEEE